MVSSVKLAAERDHQEQSGGQVSSHAGNNRPGNYDHQPRNTDSQADQDNVWNPCTNAEDFEKEKVERLSSWWRELKKVPINHLTTQHPTGIEKVRRRITGKKVNRSCR